MPVTKHDEYLHICRAMMGHRIELRPSHYRRSDWTLVTPEEVAVEHIRFCPYCGEDPEQARQEAEAKEAEHGPETD